MLNNIFPNDYNSRLNHTIVCYDGYPVNLQVVSETKFLLLPLHRESHFKSMEIKPNDMKLDISTPDLGYFNINKEGGNKYAAFIERLPVRRWRQGLCSTNCQLYYLNGKNHTRRNKEEMGEAMYSEGFESMILHKYPTVARGLETLTEKGVTSVALSRNIALSRNDNVFVVWYKKDEVGYITPGKNPVVKVPSEPMAYIVSKHLRELPWVVD